MTDTVKAYIFLMIVTRATTSFLLQISDVVNIHIIDHQCLTRDHLSFLQFSSMGRQDKSSSPAVKQCLATECWLAKLGIRDSQNAKARLRVARDRAKKMQMQPPAKQNSSIPATTSSPLDDRSFYLQEISSNMANFKTGAQGGRDLKGLASARALCPLPEYVPLISE
ncbi:hypothetical protein BDR03DRAFT_1017439 [Suillus americanus]|nr:hypothetical protein BDR03DRAFT_1017439 [Suillus americanus]